MAIKVIILHQGQDQRSGARLEVSIALARAHDARIIGIFAEAVPTIPEKMWRALRGEAVQRWRSTLESKASQAEEVFRARVAGEGLSGDWRVIEGDPTEALLSATPCGDLTVVGQASPDEPVNDGVKPGDLVLAGGGPVLVVPYAGEFRTVGRRVLIAWNGSRQAVRALRDAIPILQQAESVTVLNIGPARARRVAGKDVGTYLERHGIKADARHTVSGSETEAVDPSLTTVGDYGSQEVGAWTRSQHAAVGEIEVGDALLSAAADCAADLIVMGAYGHSRIRELVLGGATRHLLKAMTVPVLMSN